MEISQMVQGAIYPKKQVKSDVNRTALAAMLNLFIMLVIVMGGMIVRMMWVLFVEVLKNDDFERALDSADAIIESDAFWNGMMESGLEYLISVSFGMIFMWLILSPKAPFKKVFEVTNKMNLKSFVKCLCVFMSIQMPIILLDLVIEFVLNKFGLTAMAGTEMATAGSTTISMFLYSSIGAPVGEELLYRGFIMKSLEKYGKTFAILISSILFGLMHTNLTQSLFAMLVGLVLGYVASNYSLKWAILLHMINNCLFGEILTFLIKDLNEDIQTIVEMGILGGFAIAGLVLVLLHRHSIGRYIKEHAGAKQYYKFAFTSIWFLLFIIGCSLSGLTVIERL